MTIATLDHPTRRETLATYRGRALVVALSSHSLTIRQKGRRRGYVVPYDAIFSLGAKLAANVEREEKRALRASRRRGGR